ncbi:hypothetical protein GGR53DRAFT_387535 [Hypoxylon sp. FL1150]|nr:hypothetical protein GGR53DRAFT_387535 [Hypoxylon sp. FL1150]
MAEERPEMTTRPPVSIDLMHLLDPEVLKKIHEFMCSNYADVEKSTVISISGHGRSLWTRTARIDVECKTSSDTLFIRSFFIKVTPISHTHSLSLSGPFPSIN